MSPLPIGARPRLLHTMLRVRDLEASIRFYVNQLGMKLLRRQDFPDGQFTLAFIGYGAERAQTVLELTHNWGVKDYEHGSAFGHIAIGVADVYAATDALANSGVKVTRAAGPLKGDPSEIIAFVEDPDGYKVELINGKPTAKLAAL